MWNFLTGYFVGRSSGSDSGSGCGTIIGGIIGIFVLFYLIKWMIAVDTFLSQAVEEKSLIAILLYPYLIQQFHHLTGSAALWASFLIMIAAAVAIGFASVVQAATTIKKLAISLIPLYLYLLIIYQTINGGKVLWETSILKTVGWYILGFAIICLIIGMTSATTSMNTTANNFDVSKHRLPRKDLNYDQTRAYLHEAGFIQIGSEQLIVHGETLSNDQENAIHIDVFGATLIQRIDINDGNLTVCEVNQGKAFDRSGIRIGTVITSITLISNPSLPVLRPVKLNTVAGLSKNLMIGDRLQISSIVGYGTEKASSVIHEVNIESHIRAVK